MKKIIGLACGALLLFTLTATANAQFSFKITGGLNYLGGGDFAKGTQGFGDETIFALQDLGYVTTGEFSPARLGMNFGAEFIYNISESIGVGLGVGYLGASKVSDVKYTPSVAGIVFDSDMTMSAIPITANFYYNIPAGGNLKFYFNLGLGYYIAKADSVSNILAWIVPATIDLKTTGGGLGFHGGIGLEYDFSPSFGLVFEIKGRYASFSNFSGDGILTVLGSSDTYSGDLMAYPFDIPPGSGNIWLGTGDMTWGSGATKAKVDFSGFSAVIGVVIHI